jgi:hypothetical protein
MEVMKNMEFLEFLLVRTRRPFTTASHTKQEKSADFVRGLRIDYGASEDIIRT